MGINTSTPSATLDVVAKTTGTATTTPEGLIAPRLTISDLNSKVPAYGTAQAGTLIYVTDSSNGAPAGQTVNITAAGYYFFDGSVWQKVTTGNVAANNIYTNDGTLLANRTVTMADKTLAFNSAATTGTSHFSVDGSTLSVDALNNRVGIGTIVPTERFQVSNGDVLINGSALPRLVLQSNTPEVANQNNNNGTIVFLEGANSISDGMFIVHTNSVTGTPGGIGNALQLGAVETGVYRPVINILGPSKKVLIGDSPLVPTGGDNSKMIINNGTTNGGLQILDGTQGANKVLMSDANGVGTWRVGAMITPSTVYTWDNTVASNANLPNNTPFVYGPYTVAQTGWYQVQSRWFYFQNIASSADRGAGQVWMQINTTSTNAMDASPSLSIATQPMEERIVITDGFGLTMIAGKMMYLTAGTNYYVHVNSFHASRAAEQRFLLNYLQ